MIQIYGSLLVLLKIVETCQWVVDLPGVDGGSLIDGERLEGFRKTLTGSTREYCKNFELKSALDRLARIETMLNEPGCTYTNMRYQLQTLHENIEDDLRNRLHWQIPLSKIAHADTAKDIPFPNGPDLPSARKEWFEAEQCYELERYTACVMHLMRLAEVGLRTLARHLVGDKIGNRDLEFVDWKPMLAAVEPIVAQKLSALDNEPRTVERERAVKFYSDVMSHLKYFKTIRDVAAHARGVYDDGQALSALHRIKEFMTLLAEQLDSPA